MSTCRRIDRIAYTKGIVRVIGESEHNQVQPHSEHANVQHGEICPECGQRSLFPDSGCWKCISCGFNFCEVRR